VRYQEPHRTLPPQSPDVPQAKPLGDHTTLGGFVSNTVVQMISSRAQRPPKNRIAKTAVSLRALAKQFLELNRLRREVDELEARLAANRSDRGGSHGVAPLIPNRNDNPDRDHS
jgi:hypothetical protein